MTVREFRAEGALKEEIKKAFRNGNIDSFVLAREEGRLKRFLYRKRHREPYPQDALLHLAGGGTGVMARIGTVLQESGSTHLDKA